MRGAREPVIIPAERYVFCDFLSGAVCRVNAEACINSLVVTLLKDLLPL